MKKATCKNFEDYLRQYRYRVTPERLATCEAALHCAQKESFFTVNEVRAEIEQLLGHVSIMSVYSSFKLMQEAGLLVPTPFMRDKAQLFALKVDVEGRVFYACTNCEKLYVHKRKTLALEGLPMPPRGFGYADCMVFGFSLCASCKRKLQAKAKQKEEPNPVKSAR